MGRIYKNIESMLSRLNYVISPIKRSIEKREYLSPKSVFSWVILLIIIFILSGGVALLVNPNLKVILTTSISGSESPLEFTIFFFLNCLFFLSLYMINKGVRGRRVDDAIVIIGILMLFTIIIINWWLLNMKI